ncbi:MAG: hypothetical protein ACJ762_15200 [Solirubrobacteraceae bacterium]
MGRILDALHRVSGRLAERRSAATAPGEPWSCACGAAYRFTGEGRHRVFWPAEGSPADPVLGRACLRCGAELPA